MPKKKTVQSSITSMGFPLLQKPGEMCVGRQIGVPGKFWNFNRGRMSEEEAATLFKCTVRGFHALHKWAGGGAPSQAMELQEMGVDGQGSTEPGGSKVSISVPAILVRKLPPDTQETTPTDTSIVSSSSVDVVPDMSGKSISGDARFPHLPPSKAVVLKHWTLVSDDLITSGSNSGQYKGTFKCNIMDGEARSAGLIEASCTTEARLSPLPISSDMSQI